MIIKENVLEDDIVLLTNDFPGLSISPERVKVEFKVNKK